MYDIFILYYTSRVHSSWIEREGGGRTHHRFHFEFISISSGCYEDSPYYSLLDGTCHTVILDKHKHVLFVLNSYIDPIVFLFTTSILAQAMKRTHFIATTKQWCPPRLTQAVTAGSTPDIKDGKQKQNVFIRSGRKK